MRIIKIRDQPTMEFTAYDDKVQKGEKSKY